MPRVCSPYAGDPSTTGKPFNDAYRYMDWLLTVPLLLIEIIFCMKIPDAESTPNEIEPQPHALSRVLLLTASGPIP